MNTLGLSSTPADPVAHAGMILRFVDAFPTAAAVVKRPRKVRVAGRSSEFAGQSGSPPLTQIPAGDQVLIIQL